MPRQESQKPNKPKIITESGLSSLPMEIPFSRTKEDRSFIEKNESVLNLLMR